MLIDLRSDAKEIIFLGICRQDGARAKDRDPKDVPSGMPHGYERDILGVRGEFAVSRALGLEPDVTRATSNGDPDPHHDGFYRGWCYDAKDTKHPKGSMLYQKKTHYLTQDVWILAVQVEEGNEEELWRMRIGGWAWVRDMPDLWDVCFFDETAKCIKQSQLNNFSDFQNIHQKGLLF
jgi:hypothetical protein